MKLLNQGTGSTGSCPIIEADRTLIEKPQSQYVIWTEYHQIFGNRDLDQQFGCGTFRKQSHHLTGDKVK